MADRDRRQANQTASQPWQMPPLIKLYEALGAVADERIKLIDERLAEVKSSEGDKSYTVEVSGIEVSSNDNGSYWQGYLGYPGIAVMLARGLLPLDRAIAQSLQGIPWKELNRRNRNDYDRSLKEVERILIEREADPGSVREQCEAILAALSKFAPVRGVRRRPPRGQ